MSEPLPAFVEAHQPTWLELGTLVDGAGGSVRRLDPDSVRRLGRLYRQVVADLAYARRCYPKDPVTVRLDELARRTRPLVYGTVRERQSVLHFATTGYWQRVAERPLLLAVSMLLLFGPALVVGAWANANPEPATRVAQVSPLTASVAENGPRDPDTDTITDPAINLGISGQIFTNNARAALVAFAGGLTAGTLTVVSLIFNGLLLGLVAGLAVHGGHGDAFIRLIVPHGVLELSLIGAAGAAGLRVAWALIHPGHRSRIEALTAEGRASVELALGSAVLLVPCGFVEGFVTPRGLPVAGALTVGIGLGVAYWALVLWRGFGTRRAERARAVPAGT